MKSYISAIKAVLRESDIKIEEDQYLLSSLTKACRLQNDQIKTCLPIKKGLLGIILWQILVRYDNQPYLSILFRTIFSTMYFGLLRMSEVVGDLHAIKACDIHVGENKNKFLLILRTSKTHWKNMKPQLIKITAMSVNHNITKRQLPCPYQLLRDYAVIRGSYSSHLEPFFVMSDKSPVSAQQIATNLKLVIAEASFDLRLYSSHSLRIGRTVNLYNLGLTVETIKKIRRWHSNSVYRYLRQ